MIIGKFQQDNGVYTGSVQPLTGAIPVRIAPTDLKGIDYLVTSRDGGIELGVAWNKVGKENGTKYVSVKLDSPFLSAPISCSLFKQADGTYNLVWNRQKPKKEAAGEQAAA
jgi:uncharacterized protein (DUF736 family)